ncbi:MAG: Ig domain-containing protein, partial [Verrucomicrobia bacterium]|nr:Ig domain-containing protein [Verrucomicrobiota bacterium]
SNLQEYTASSDPRAAGTGFVKRSSTVHLTGNILGSFIESPTNKALDLQLVGNFTWRTIVHFASVPASNEFKFVSDHSWATSWGVNVGTPAGTAVQGPTTSNLTTTAITAVGYYVFTLNEFTGEWTVGPLESADGNSNLLPDAYEVFYGGYLDPKLTALVTTTDYDGDGQTTAAEYTAGTNPTRDVGSPTINLAVGVQQLGWVAVGATVAVPSEADVVTSDSNGSLVNVAVTISNGGNFEQSINTASSLLSTITYTAADVTGNSATVSRLVVVGDAAPSWLKLQGPVSNSISTIGSLSVYGRIYMYGVTPGAGQVPNIQAWVGVNSANTDPSGWASGDWKTASYNAGFTGGDDEYSATINGSDLTAGTYYYAVRFQIGSGAYFYAGVNAAGTDGGPWNGTTSNSGVLTVSQAVVRDVTFAVNMNVRISAGTFSVASHTVEVKGTFNNWAGNVLTDTDSDGIYTGIIAIEGAEAASVEYKYYATGTSALGFETRKPDANRTITLGANGVALNPTVVDFGDIPPAPVISSSLTATGQVGVAFSYSITASGNPASYTASGLPDGLSVNSVTGEISGTPTTAASGTIVAISATNAGGAGTANLSLTVDPATPTGTTFAGWSSGGALTSDSLTKYAIGGAGSLTGESVKQTSALDGTTLSITAIVRTDDAKLTVVGQAVTSLGDYATPASVVEVAGDATGIDQTGVPTGCAKQKFSVKEAADAARVNGDWGLVIGDW